MPKSKSSSACALPVACLFATGLLAGLQGCAHRAGADESTHARAALGASGGACDDADDDDDDDDDEISIADVPAHVAQAAIKAVPGFVLEEAVRVGEGDSAVYELEGEADGTEYEIEVDATGAVLEIEADAESEDGDDD
ncbi:MAG: PepSY domain-containing protein [Phycisphaerae bacterium]|nr:PepSY domain-containing protein [Phycisphaerae bacterium]